MDRYVCVCTCVCVCVRVCVCVGGGGGGGVARRIYVILIVHSTHLLIVLDRVVG